MSTVIFYSWQSDLPNSTNRGLIQWALERAAKEIRSDESVAVEPVIDRDTTGIPGSPDIAATILEKIDNCDVFSCDVSIINPGGNSRPTPNPNVLIELGYALKRMGWNRVLMIMNTAYGSVESLPFDLRMKRVITYTAHKGSPDLPTERKKLQTTLTAALKAILSHAETVPATELKPPDINDRINAFRRERLALISSDNSPMRIEHGGRLIIHIIPFSAFANDQSLDVKDIDNNHNFFRPIGSMEMTPRFNLEGVINFRGGEKCYGYTQIFRNGIIEATKANIIIAIQGLRNIPYIPFSKIGSQIFEVLPKYLNGLKALDVHPPIVVMISLQEVNGVYLGIGKNGYSSYYFNVSELLLPEIIIGDYGSEHDYQKAMRPAFDALWNAVGSAASPYFDENDIWVGKYNGT